MLTAPTSTLWRLCRAGHAHASRGGAPKISRSPHVSCSREDRAGVDVRSLSEPRMSLADLRAIASVRVKTKFRVLGLTAVIGARGPCPPLTPSGPRPSHGPKHVHVLDGGQGVIPGLRRTVHVTVVAAAVAASRSRICKAFAERGDAGVERCDRTGRWAGAVPKRAGGLLRGVGTEDGGVDAAISAGSRIEDVRGVSAGMGLPPGTLPVQSCGRRCRPTLAKRARRSRRRW